MKVYILTNALDYGDAVSTHCILLKQCAEALGIPAFLHAEFSHEFVAEHTTPLKELTRTATADDVLLHQLFNETSLMHLVEQFPGRRVLMYHNITPAHYFPPGSATYLSCSRGLRLAQSLTSLYDLAVGMSDFSCQDLGRMGFPRTGIFPLFLDLRRILSLVPNPRLLSAEPGGTRLLFVGRIAPNKRIEDLLRLLAEYRNGDAGAHLVLMGNDWQHPSYRESLLDLAKSLSLRIGVDVRLTGKVPDSDMAAYYRTADAFVSMSEHEGFGAPLIESMAFGVPVFAYAGGASEQTLGGAGVLFREKDFVEMAKTIRDVLSDPSRRAQILAGQYQRVDSFSPACQRRELGSLLEHLASIPLPTGRGDCPQVSVVINTCDRGWHLDRCLESLRAQEYENFEVVVVNGPSTDDTEERLKRFENRIRIARTDSRVLSVSRNLGIANASGKLVAFLDDDAVADPRWLKELVPAFEDPSVGGVGGMVYRMNGRDVEFRNGIIDRQGMVRWNEPTAGTHWHWEEGWLNTVSGNNCIFRRASLEAVGGFDERIEYYHDEADVVMKIETAGFRTLHRPEALVYHEAAKSHNRLTKHELNWFAVTKNTLYCALKNYTGDEPKLRLAARIVIQLIRIRMRPLGELRRGGEINRRSWVRMEWACVRGITAGLFWGMFGEAKPGTIPKAAQSILLYCSGARASLSIGLLSQNLPSESPGGIATYTLTLAESLRDLGCTVHVISAGAYRQDRFDRGIWFHTANPRRIADIAEVGAGLPTLSKNLDHSNGVRLAVLDVVARWGLDLVESPNWDAEGLMTALEHRLPLVVRVHSPLFKVMQMQQWPETADLLACCNLEELLLRHADGVSGSTTAVLELVNERYGLAQDTTALIPLGLAAAEAEAEESITRSHEECTVLFVGRLERRKGIHTLLDAIPEVLRHSPSTRFEIVGRDLESSGNGFRSWAERWRVDHPLLVDRVRFIGEVDDQTLQSRYAGCDLFVAPSLYESFGLIYLEAMAHGKAVIGTNAGGIPEVVAHNETGILVPPQDSQALASAILRLIGDEDLRQRFGREGLNRFRKLFSPRALGARTFEYYRDVITRWRTEADVWRGSALGSHRHPSTQIVWVPETGSVALRAEAGPARTVWYGPYISLDPGTYRAEFTCWMAADGPIRGDAWICTLDVVNMDTDFLAEKRLSEPDFAGCSGWVADIYFTVDDSLKGTYEFRVHTSGAVDLYIRDIKVRRWPRRPTPLPAEPPVWSWAAHSTQSLPDAEVARSINENDSAV